MLGAYDVRYMPRIVIKGQILVDFVVEFTVCVASEGKEIVGVMTTSTSIILPWEVFTDGAANRKGAGVGIVLVTPEKLIME